MFGVGLSSLQRFAMLVLSNFVLTTQKSSLLIILNDEKMRKRVICTLHRRRQWQQDRPSESTEERYYEMQPSIAEHALP